MANFLSNLFTPVQRVQEAPAPQAPQPATPLAPQNPGATSQAIEQSMQAPADNSLPLDSFKDIWQTPTTSSATADPWSQPMVTMDQAQLSDKIKSIDFTRSIDPARAQAALNGDPAALMEIINGATRNAFEMSLQMNAASLNAAGNTMGERVKSYMPEAYRTEQLKSAPVSNPILEHPSAQPLLQATRQQIARQNPNLSVAQVNAKAEQYFADFSSAFAANTPEAKAASQQQTKTDSSGDFSSWLN